MDWDGEKPIRAAEPAIPPKNRRNWKNIRGGLFVLAISLPMLTHSSWLMTRAVQSNSWPSVDGQILSSSVTSINNATPTPGTGVHVDDTKQAAIRYQYTISGSTYQNETVRFGQIASSTTLFGKAQATSERFPIGPAKIYYDPDNVSDSVLEPGVCSDVIIRCSTATVFVIAGIVLLMHRWKLREI